MMLIIKTALLLIIASLLSCSELEEKYSHWLDESIPNEIPTPFKNQLKPKDKLIHRGVFSPDLKTYYYTLSDVDYRNFTIMSTRFDAKQWSTPKVAFFNSEHDDHGMSFSPDGNTIYFSSTRPTGKADIAKTWHLWKCEKKDGQWMKAEFIDIPNLRQKLVSHPSMTNSERLYFHSSNLDYSEMDIYYADKVNGQFQNAKALVFTSAIRSNKCTPYISPEEDYIIYAVIEQELKLTLSFRDKNNKWSIPQTLNDQINNKGQGNPYVTPNHPFLFYTTGEDGKSNWQVNWVNIKDQIKNK